MKTLIENQILSDIEKARSGVYENNRKNRKLGRVGQKYGSQKQNEEKEKKDSSDAKEKVKEEEKKRGYRLDDSAIIKDPNKTKAEKISEIKDKYAKLMKKHADELNRMGIPFGHHLALLQRTRDKEIKEIEAQEEQKE
ncbi:hypothetical protein [Phocaeicola plebeius]